jgi:hypothetical protein
MNTRRPLFAIGVSSKRLRAIERELHRIADALERVAPLVHSNDTARIEDGALYRGLDPENVRERMKQVLAAASKQGLTVEDLLEAWEPESEVMT